MTLSHELLEVLACPQCKGGLLYEEADKRLICQTCRLAFPIHDDIPVMLVDEAQPLTDL